MLADVLAHCHCLTSISLANIYLLNDDKMMLISAQRSMSGFYHEGKRGSSPAKIVSLSGCYRLSDHSVTWLMSKLRHIQEVDLTGCENVTDVSVKILAHHCYALSVLRLSGCHSITDKALINLAKHQVFHR